MAESLRTPHALPLHTNGHDDQLTTFRDSRGQPVPRWPDIVLPSTCVIVYRPQAGQRELLCHQRADNVTGHML